MDEFDATATLARIEERLADIAFTTTNAANILPALLNKMPASFAQDGFQYDRVIFQPQTLVCTIRSRAIGGRHVAELAAA
jgi:hypothetical protein